MLHMVSFGPWFASKVWFTPVLTAGMRRAEKPQPVVAHPHNNAACGTARWY